MGDSHASADGLLQYGREGTLLFLVSAASAWSDQSWTEMLEGTLAMERSMGSPALLVFTYFPDGMPTASQRRMSVETTQKSRLADRVAVLTDSAIVRGGFTAIQWVLGKQTDNKAFRPTEVQAAIAWLARRHSIDVPSSLRRADALIRAAHAAAGRPLVR
jgi:hypothetical protein